ncbi:MAG: molybdopterin-binding protein [Eubacteriales bacterium]|nr:molybdopterin-binding protein [Eubacteriales bacterium]
MGTLKAICISEKKGMAKHEVESAELIAGYGIKGDAHAGNWHRQVSLLSFDAVEEFKSRSAFAGGSCSKVQGICEAPGKGGEVNGGSIGIEICNGAFGENLLVEGEELERLSRLPVGTRFRIGGGVLLELTQIGKACHDHCAIYEAMGDCIMPREGVFAVVLEGGMIKKGDKIEMAAADPERAFAAARITLSDKGAAGEREDKSGPIIDEMLEAAGYVVVEKLLLSDDEAGLRGELMRLSDQRQVDLILTTGGTGFSQRDSAPEATIAVCDRMAPGIAEAVRAYSMTITPRAMLSRAASGIRRNTLIINLPGSPKAVQETMEFLLPTLEHGLGILRGLDGECAR